MEFDLSHIDFSLSDKNKNLTLPKQMSLELAEEIGLHLGDGSMNIYKGKGLFQLRGHKEDDKEHYIGRISELYNRLYNLNLNLRVMESTGVIGFQIWSNTLVEFKSTILDLPLGKKDNLQIPNTIKTNKQKFAFIRGLFDTDGCLYLEKRKTGLYPRIEISSTSPKLCIQIQEFLISQGINATYYVMKRKNPNWKPLSRVIIRGHLNLKKWVKLIGTNNPKHKRKISLVVEWKNGGPAEI